MATILIAEDNDMNMELLCTILTANGHHAICASNGKEALESIADTVPDMVLMDIQMPVLDGYQTLKAIRINEAMDTVPVIAVTGNAMIHDRDRILGAGFQDVVTKPYSIKSVLDVIGKHLS